MNFKTIKSYAKINLSLGVIGKLNSSIVKNAIKKYEVISKKKKKNDSNNITKKRYVQ